MFDILNFYIDYFIPAFFSLDIVVFMFATFFCFFCFSLINLILGKKVYK